MNKLLLLIIIGILLFLNVAAQDYNKERVLPPNPIAASLKLYGDIPVSYSTGVPDIRIPIYTIQVGNFSLPIELRYHIRSIKPRSCRTNVALGWTLHFGGIVTRTAYGKPDEKSDYMTYGTGVGNGNDEILKFLYDSENSNEDSEKDIFYFDINGNSGEFIILSDTCPPAFRQLGGSPIKIEGTSELSVWGGGLLGFKLTNDNGVAFRFGFGSLESAQTGGPEVNTTWNLKHIILPTNDTIKYTFSDPISYYDTFYSEHVYIKDQQVWGEFLEILDPSISICNLPNVSIGNSASYTRHIWEQNVKTISFPNGRVEFILGDNDRIIKEVKIYEGNRLIKAFEFALDETASMDGMYLLQKVIEKDSGETTVDEYQFDYYDKTVIGENANTDYWGYYNGLNANASAVPYNQYTAITGYPHFWCAPPTNYMPQTWGLSKASTMSARYNVLKKIIYPMKGYTEFEYGLNKMILNTNEVQGNGLRVEQINNTDNNGQTSIRHFNYIPSSNGSVSMWIDEYATTTYKVGIFKISSSEYVDPLNPFVSYRGGIGWYRQIDYSSVMGHRIMSSWEPRYQTVTESIGQNYSQGRNVYHFNFNSYDINFSHSMYPSNYQNVGLESFLKNIKGWDDGNLIKKEIFDDNNSLVKKVEYNYNYFYEDTIQNTHVKKITDYVRNYADNEPDDSIRRENWQYLVDWYYPYDFIILPAIYGYYNYNIVTGWTEKTSETETSYFNGNPLTKTTTYEYKGGKKYYPSSITQIKSDSSLLKTDLKYPYDFQNPPYDSMTGLNMISSTVVQVDSLNNSFLRADSTAYSASFFYKPAAQYTQTVSRDQDWERRFSYNKYDSKGNILDVSKENDINTSYIWGYNQSFPVIEAVNIEYSDLSSLVSNIQSDFESFLISLGNLENETQKNSLRLFNKTLRNALSPNSQVRTYTYSPLIGMTSQTDPNGITTYYEYDSAGRLKYIKDNDGNILKTYEYHYKQ